MQDVIILGAGGAGMMCAIEAGRRGRRVLLMDHYKKLGGKILISGGGRCNFTNLGASPVNYVSENPHFMKSALSRYPSSQFIKMVESYGIAYHEKKLGQLFCDESAQSIVDMLKAGCDGVGAQFRLECRIDRVETRDGGGFRVETSQGPFEAESLVVATGGLSIPKIGATDLGYRLAAQFGLRVTERAPALDGFVFSSADQPVFADLAGISIDCVMSCKGMGFRENLLFTHTGLSGPAALQASLHWYPGDEVSVNLLPELSAGDWLIEKKKAGSRSLTRNLLAEKLPARFAERFVERLNLTQFPAELSMDRVPDKALQDLGRRLNAWTFVPSGTVGYQKAEVTRGGVDTRDLSSKTMQANQVPGLYFVGEVVDVTGWLGGYNFQWAWASGWAAGQVV
ncbi:MAG: NAD(P)/FAD-dependent oxidoreductase [Bacteriovoracia bacterium]